jgi:glycosyltransferase involved in cell wall biosynthesis
MVQNVAVSAHEAMIEWPTDLSDFEVDRVRVGVVTVTCNTRDLLARMLYGVLRVVEPGTIVEVVVVDNASEDGSRELAQRLADAGIIHCISNDTQRYHGPGLTQGVNLLADRARHTRPVDLIWALDSDVLVLRPDVVRAAATAMSAFGAVFAADPDHYSPSPPRVTTENLGMCSTLFDPAVVWQSRHRPFLEDGDPSRHMQADLTGAGHRRLAFPFCSDAYVLHLGRSTLAQVAARNATDNRYYAWAVERHEPHYALRPDGAELASHFEASYRAAVPDDNIDTLVDALRDAS